MKSIKALFLLLFFVHFSYITNAQSKKLSMGFNTSIDYNYRTLKNLSSSSTVADSISTLNKNQLPKTSVGYGFNLAYKITNTFQAEIGYRVSHSGYRTEDVYGFSFTNPTQIDYVETIYNYNYSDVIFRFNYLYETSIITLIPSIGISSNFLYDVEIITKTFYTDVKPSETKRTSVNPSNNKTGSSLYCSLGAAYKISNNFNFRLEPFYTRSFSPINSNSISTTFYNAGVNFGLYVNL